jgi:serine/threonine protein kinase/Flp pilus assembly protein TadD
MTEPERPPDLKDWPEESASRISGNLTSEQQLSSGQNMSSTISIDNRYRVDAQIGSGGMGAVYRAQHLLLNRAMAVKIIHAQAMNSPKAIMRFQQEAKAASALSHDNIASVKEFGLTSEGLPFLSMDYVEGSSLAEILKDGPLAPARAINIFAQVCAGMAHAHKRGVLHRDLKPANILITEEDNRKDVVKIVDFGIAKILPGGDEDSVKLTQTGELFGTPCYMSPEQWHAEEVDARTDVYSLGCVMYEAIAGKPPFVGPSVAAVINGHVNEVPEPFSTQAKNDRRQFEGLENVILRCLEKDPNLRYQTMEDVEAALKLVQEGGKPSRGVSYSSRRNKKLVRLAVASAILLPVVACSFAVLTVVKRIVFAPIWLRTLGDGETQMRISAWEPAEALIRRAADEAEEGKASNADRRTIYYQLGQDYLNMKQYDRAGAAFEKALQFSDANSDPLPTANTLEELALCLRAIHFTNGAQEQSEAALHDYHRALDLAKQALKLKEAGAGVDHPYVSYSLDILAAIDHTLGDFANAEAAYRRAIKIDEASPGTRPRAEKHWESLSNCFQAQGKKSEAIEALGHALTMSKDIYGADSQKARRLEARLNSMSQ